MAESAKKRSAKAEPEPGDAALTETAAAQEPTADAGVEQAAAEQSARETTEPVPPAQEQGDGGGEQAAVPTDDSATQMDKAVLISNAAAMLPGVDPVAVRGVLAAAPDQISPAEARQRVERFLAAPIPTSQEA